MHFPKRVYGIEIEFGVIEKKHNGTIRDALKTSPYPLFQNNPNGLCGQQPGTTRIWGTNGSCIYVDTGQHPEYATAECRSIRELVAQYKAGDILAAQVFGKKNDKCDFTFILIKNNVSWGPSLTEGQATFGCHENYFTYNEYSMEGLQTRAFLPFLATRQIIDGAGGWLEDGTYVISPRALYINTAVGGDTMLNRAIINTRGMHDTIKNRLHLIHGDSNILEFSLYLKIGITSLVLSLIENAHPSLPSFFIPVVDALHETSRNLDPLLPVIVSLHGERLSPYEIQIRYLEAVRIALSDATFDSEETEAELRHIYSLWEQTLNAIYRQDEKWMLGRLDRVTKKYLGERQLALRPDGSAKMPFLRDFDLTYHNISDPRLQERMNKQWADRRIITNADIQHACIRAPQDTRARMRGEFVAKMLAAELSTIGYMDWEALGHNTENLFYKMPDPLLAHDPLFDSFADTYIKIKKFSVNNDDCTT